MKPKPAMPPVHFFVLRVSLERIKPAIWRRFIVPSSIRLDLLHDVLQVVMGWEDYHLHEFVLGDRRFTEDPEEAEHGEEEWGVILGTLVHKAKEKFRYEYDFGDGWAHLITVEKIAHTPLENELEIFCINGARACPPEDVGGPSGYAQYLKAMKSRRHPRHEELRQWRGEFDPEQFDMMKVNAALAKLSRWARGRGY